MSEKNQFRQEITSSQRFEYDDKWPNRATVIFTQPVKKLPGDVLTINTKLVVSQDDDKEFRCNFLILVNDIEVADFGSKNHFNDAKKQATFTQGFNYQEPYNGLITIKVVCRDFDNGAHQTSFWAHPGSFIAIK